MGLSATACSAMRSTSRVVVAPNLSRKSPAGGQVSRQRMMVDDLNAVCGLHAADRLHGLRVHQDHVIDPALGQVLQPHERQHVRVDGQECLEVAVHLARQDRSRVGIQASGSQHAGQRIEIRVLVRQDDADGLIGNDHPASLATRGSVTRGTDKRPARGRAFEGSVIG